MRDAAGPTTDVGTERKGEPGPTNGLKRSPIHRGNNVLLSAGSAAESCELEQIGPLIQTDPRYYL